MATGLSAVSFMDSNLECTRFRSREGDQRSSATTACPARPPPIKISVPRTACMSHKSIKDKSFRLLKLFFKGSLKRATLPRGVGATRGAALIGFQIFQSVVALGLLKAFHLPLRGLYPQALGGNTSGEHSERPWALYLEPV